MAAVAANDSGGGGADLGGVRGGDRDGGESGSRERLAGAEWWRAGA